MGENTVSENTPKPEKKENTDQGFDNIGQVNNDLLFLRDTIAFNE